MENTVPKTIVAVSNKESGNPKPVAFHGKGKKQLTRNVKGKGSELRMPTKLIRRPMPRWLPIFWQWRGSVELRPKKPRSEEILIKLSGGRFFLGKIKSEAKPEETDTLIKST